MCDMGAIRYSHNVKKKSVSIAITDIYVTFYVLRAVAVRNTVSMVVTPFSRWNFISSWKNQRQRMSFRSAGKFLPEYTMGRDIVVDVATPYGLDSRGI